MAWTATLPDWTTEPVRSQDLQTMVDVLAELTGAWTPYDLAWTSSGTQPSIGNGTLSGRSMQVGKLLAVDMLVIAGNTTTFGTNQYFLSLPVDARIAGIPLACYLLDSGTANKAAIAIVTSGLDTVAIVQNTTDLTATAPHTMANGDAIHVCGILEAA